jgi:hypothetical protein
VSGFGNGYSGVLDDEWDLVMFGELDSLQDVLGGRNIYLPHKI